MKKLAILLSLISLPVMAQWRFKNAALHEEAGGIRLNLETEGNGETPVVSIRDGVLQLEGKDLIIWPKLEKQIAINGTDHTLLAYQYSKDSGRIRIIRKQPWQLETENLKLEKSPNGWSVLISDVKGAINTASKNSGEKYDEVFLENLLKEKSRPADEIQPRRDSVKTIQSANNKKPSLLTNDFPKETQLTVASGMLESKQRKDESNPIWTMTARFGMFLALIVFGLWTVAWVFRKGFFNRSKLGFLKNEFLVSILGTTYLGPKRSLVVVRVGKQVFLIGNSEAGISNLGELADAAGLLKSSEKNVTGHNFDDEMSQADKGSKAFRLKELDTMRSNEEALQSDGNLSKELDTFTKREDREKISEQIKRKLKTLKALQ